MLSAVPPHGQCPAASPGVDTLMGSTGLPFYPSKYLYSAITGWWLTYPSEKYDNSSVGMIVYSQLIWKVIQNSMVPVITNQKISVSKMVIDAVFWLVFECIFDWI